MIQRNSFPCGSFRVHLLNYCLTEFLVDGLTPLAGKKSRLILLPAQRLSYAQNHEEILSNQAGSFSNPSLGLGRNGNAKHGIRLRRIRL